MKKLRIERCKICNKIIISSLEEYLIEVYIQINSDEPVKLYKTQNKNIKGLCFFCIEERNSVERNSEN